MTTRHHEFDEALESLERDAMEELRMTKPKKKKSVKKTEKFTMYRGQVMAVYGNFAEGFQLVGPFTDFEAADAACPDAEWLWSVEPPSDPQTNWQNNGIQFARLIAELEATELLNEHYVKELADSMDLEPSQVEEIVERAKTVWDEIKRQTMA